MKWIVIATDNAKRLFTLKAYSSGKYSVVETSENIPQTSMMQYLATSTRQVSDPWKPLVARNSL
ncbi:hypothetical protein ACKF11_03840 [Methylobacillus sp. Pita2]|uniref:hypothetical protein n=1 Tax=Methylobacillus sp. Pita2 TaxID=3383245 RepID=UPI0038B55755